jgi:sodium transport system permease protein
MRSGFSAYLTVLAKELRENARDRRTLISALLFGPLVPPILFTALMVSSVERHRSAFEQPVALAVRGGERAPGLIQYLAARGAKIRPESRDPDQVKNASRPAGLLLSISADYEAALRAGRPATVALYGDSSDRGSLPDEARVAAWLHAYGAELGARRLQARGVSPAAGNALAVDEVDWATPASRSAVLLGILSYFLVFATLMGGLYVAIDSTAGERERGSLEPLLTLPVRRAVLALAKLTAAAVGMVVSLALAVATFAICLRIVPLETLGMRANFGPLVAVQVLLVVLPFVPLGAALMLVVASYTRSYREAQTWLSVILLVPTLPIVFASVYGLSARPALIAVPSLGQHLLIQRLLRAEGLSLGLWSLSAATSLAAAALLIWLVIRLWQREALLG